MWMGDCRKKEMVPRGLEPRTLRLLAVRSSQLSYETLWAYLICIIAKAKTSRAMLGHVHKSSSIEPSQLEGRALSTTTTTSSWHIHLLIMDLFCLSRTSCIHFCIRSSSAREDQTLWTSLAASNFVSSIVSQKPSCCNSCHFHNDHGKGVIRSLNDNTKQRGLARIWTAIAGFRVQSANRYTTRPCYELTFLAFSDNMYLNSKVGFGIRKLGLLFETWVCSPVVRVLVRTNAAAISLHASLGEMLGMGFKSKSKQEEKTLTIQCIEANS